MIEQRTEEWFKQRVDMITGSRVGGILGLSPFNKPEDVMRSMVREHHGAPSEFEGNVATEYGNEHEDAAIFALEQELGIEVEETGFHKVNDWLGASPDGLVGINEVVEIKCPYGKRNATSSEEFKSAREQPHYLAQMQIEMLCTGREECHFYQWAEGASRYELVLINDEWLDENVPKLKAFHDEYLTIIADDKLSKPYLDALETDMSDNEEWLDIETAYINANIELSLAKKKVDNLKEDLIKLAKDKKCKSEHLTVFKTERKGSIKYAQIIKDQSIEFNPEEYQGKSSTSWTIKVK